MALETQSSRNCQNPYKGWSVTLVAAIAFSHCSRSTKATYRAGGSFWKENHEKWPLRPKIWCWVQILEIWCWKSKLGPWDWNESLKVWSWLMRWWWDSNDESWNQKLGSWSRLLKWWWDSNHDRDVETTIESWSWIMKNVILRDPKWVLKTLTTKDLKWSSEGIKNTLETQSSTKWPKSL